MSNIEPQNVEVRYSAIYHKKGKAQPFHTSTFDIPCSIFCDSTRLRPPLPCVNLVSTANRNGMQTMARRHKGDFSAKHHPDTTIAPEVNAALTARISKGKITCKTAFDLAASLSLAPSVIGTAIDLQEGRITHCQLGLFGHARKSSLLEGNDSVDAPLAADIKAAQENNRLSCQQAWKIADDHNLSRLSVGRACESLHVRICRCQLGAF
jgi:hypothetical protein